MSTPTDENDAQPPTPPRMTVYEVHLRAEAEGFGYYNATVLRRPRMTLYNTRLWLWVNDVIAADPAGVVDLPVQVLRQAILLNVTNTLHWNPWPSGQPLNWADVTLTRLNPPPTPNTP